MVTTNEFPEFLKSESTYREVFNTGLEKLLRHETLNLFILVCANASFDPLLYTRLSDQLRNEFKRYEEQLAAIFSNGQRAPEADDDLLVFLKMTVIGFDALQLTKCRHVDYWEVQFNHLRSFRPSRNAAQLMSKNHKSYNGNGFSFNKPFLQQESIWKGVLQGTSIDLYYNKFPFADLHALLVPAREQCLPQFLTKSMHAFAWRFVQEAGSNIENLRLGYNAMGAYASVNHLHFQLCVKEQSFAVESKRWQHNGGIDPYPIHCYTFDTMGAAWDCIDRLNKSNQTYNVLYGPNRLYCIPRKYQGDVVLPQWSPGFSWYEMAGGFVTSNDAASQSLIALDIHAALSGFALEMI